MPPWPAVDQQTRRWLAAGCFEAIVHDLRAVLRFADGRDPEPTAAILDMAVDTLGHLLALHVTPADEQERAPVGPLAGAAQEVTGESVELAYADQGYTGDDRADAHGIRLEVIKLPEARKGFVLPPRRWVVERSFGRMARLRRLARDYERLTETLAGLHYVAFGLPMLHKAAPLFAWSS